MCGNIVIRVLNAEFQQLSWDSTGDTREGGGALALSPNAGLLCSLHFSIPCGSLSWVKVLLLKKKYVNPALTHPEAIALGSRGKPRREVLWPSPRTEQVSLNLQPGPRSVPPPGFQMQNHRWPFPLLPCTPAKPGNNMVEGPGSWRAQGGERTACRGQRYRDRGKKGQ